ncbi:MAG: DM13 domain-containing protein [Chloroflexi bacterium]|nr:DM13 domain-containing protein [Chloroflexota bacterium]MCI0644729.1 DM13 domain-containing protein [Chloroflexota bacterium]MCI0726702.1 DM13 domain-containing protein [Chloroflexota bacterium]
MKNRALPLLVVAGLVGLIIVGAAGWYLASPLFIDNKVDEAFPFEAPSQAEMEAMSPEEKATMEAEFLAAMPGEADLAGLSPEERAEVGERVDAAAAAVMSDKAMEETMPSAAAEPVALAQGQFAGADDFHQGSGNATIYQLPDGGRVLRLENFNVTNGPDLHVILVKNPAPAGSADVGSDYVDLGSLKGNLGDQNYDIPAEVDLSPYQSIVIYCVPFQVVFATATLQ